MNHFRHVRIKLNKNFKPRKKLNPYEWSNFQHVIELCKRNGFNVKSYIKYCFLNRLVPHGKGRTISDVSYLMNFPQISDYSQNKEKIEKLYAIYISILKSVLKIRGMCKETGFTVQKTIKNILSSGFICSYVSTGTISRYFLSIIPNIDTILYEATKNDRNEERHLIDGLCSTIKQFTPKAREALEMFWPESVKMTIVELCSN